MTTLKFIRYTFLILLCSMLFACSGGGGSSGSSDTTSSSSSSTDPSTTVRSLRISPSRAEVADGMAEQFTLTVTYDDGSTSTLPTSTTLSSTNYSASRVGESSDLTSSGVTWFSNNPSVASINANGLATVKAEGGTDNIIATYDGVTSAPAVLTATSAAIKSITISPLSATIAKGMTEQYSARATYADGSTSLLTSGVSWASNNANVASINAKGLATVNATSGTADITATYDGVTSATPAVLTATDSALKSVSISPLASTVDKGFMQKYSATATYENGATSALTSGVTWTSSNPDVASIDSTGYASVNATSGTTDITATYDDIESATPAVLTATASAVKSLSVSPLTSTIDKGFTEQYSATVTYADGTTSPLTATGVTWASSTPTVATIDNTGFATVNANSGTANITATYQSVTSTKAATLTAEHSPLESISVSPTTATVHKGDTEKYSATATYADGSTSPLTSGVTWKSSNTSVAIINSNGTATAEASSGTSNITATDDDITSSTNAVFTATNAELTSISVSPTAATVHKGETEKYSATGTYSDGSTSPLTSGVTWKSSDTSVATINSNGLATSEASSGTSNISATDGDITSTTNAVFTATSAELTSINVSPTAATVHKGETEKYSATGTYSDGSTSPLTSGVTWKSSDTSVATINSNGLATSEASSGTSNISATDGDITSTTNAVFTATSAELTSINVSPTAATVHKGETEKYSATGTYSDGSTSPLTSGVTWKSSDTSVATINSNGLATSEASSGTSDITASYGSLTSSAAVLTAEQHVISSIAVTTTNPSVPKGEQKQYTAVATYSDGGTLDVTSLATWDSANTSVATVNTSGLATAVASSGMTSIEAKYSGVLGVASFYATPAALQSIAITPANFTIATGGTHQYTATGTYSDGSTADLSSKVSWSAATSFRTASTLVSVSSNGLVTANSTTGAALINASYQGVTASDNVNVSKITSDYIQPDTDGVNPIYIPYSTGAMTYQLTAKKNTFSNGVSNEDLTDDVPWHSDNTSHATINSNGLLTCVKPVGGYEAINVNADGYGGINTNTTNLVCCASTGCYQSL